MPLGEDVNLDVVASLTENLSGADLQAILSDAQLEAVHSFLSYQCNSIGKAYYHNACYVVSVTECKAFSFRPGETSAL